MKSLKLNFSILLLLCAVLSYGQVGIGNTNPEALLDISASSTTSPTNSDGILIPRMSILPANATMTANQDGMLVFYTGTGFSGKGFYYWDQSIPNWVYVASGTKNTLDQAYDEGGAGAGKNITADNGSVTINGTDGFLVAGTQGSGILIDTEASGAGTRMFFNPNKAAFRAGNVTANQWDDSNIGVYSIALGRNTRASGPHSVSIGNNNVSAGLYAVTLGDGNTASANWSTAFGSNNTASGWFSTTFGQANTANNDHSTAFGFGNSASGTYSTALGYNTVASGDTSIAFGSDTNASGFASTTFGYNTTASGTASIASGTSSATGDFSVAFGAATSAGGNSSSSFGFGTSAPSFAEATFGIYNTTYSPASTFAFNTNDRLFVIGNGTTTINRSNALTIYKSGLININDAYNMPLTDGTSGQVLTTDGSGNTSWASVGSSSNFAVAKMAMSSSQSIGFNTKINFNTVVFDANNNFDTSTTRFNIVNPGIYRIKAQYTSQDFTIGGSLPREIGISIYINGSEVHRVRYDQYPTLNPINVVRSISSIFSLNSGDYIEIRSSNAFSFVINPDTRLTTFEVERVR